MQQSAELPQLLPADEKSCRQLFLPHFKSPEQCESLSQSPPPKAQGLWFEQHRQSVLGTPLHAPGVGVDVLVVMVVVLVTVVVILGVGVVMVVIVVAVVVVPVGGEFVDTAPNIDKHAIIH